MNHQAHISYDGYCWYWNCSCGAYSRGGADSSSQCRDRYNAEHAEPAAALRTRKPDAHKIVKP